MHLPHDNLINFMTEIFSRAERLLGQDNMEKLAKVRVIVFGVGGVGSWCVEGLVRSGVRNITIVDPDRVCESNINRQLMATTQTVGQVKVEVLKAHLLTINPDADIEARQEVFCNDTADSFRLDEFDIIIDCIDSLQDKVLLIEYATRTKAKFFSSMGAALKFDPTKIKVAEFWQVKGCPLARALRQRFKKSGRYPARKFKCVYSDELLPNFGSAPSEKSDSPEGAESSVLTEYTAARKAQVNGSLMHITAIFGLNLSALALDSALEL